nr:hypothetical protein [Tanacetum cinerariifolium]
DVLNYVFLASRLQSAGLQTKLLRHSGILAFGPTFNDALCVLNTSMEADILSNPTEIAASKLIKKLAYIYFTRTNNGKTYRCVLSYRLGVPLFSISKPCSACSRVFAEDIYGDHVVSCAGIIDIKHRYNDVYDTLVNICYRSGISAGDVCVDLTMSSPFTQTGMADFAPGRAVIDAAQRKRVKYEAKCATIGYGFLPFSFSSLGELEKDAVTLLKRIQKFSMAQDIRARTVVHIFNRIGFVVAKGVRAQIASRLPINVL